MPLRTTRLGHPESGPARRWRVPWGGGQSLVSRLLVEGLGHFQFEPVKNKVAVKFMFRFLSISVGQRPERAAAGSRGAHMRSVYKELLVCFPE